MRSRGGGGRGEENRSRQGLIREEEGEWKERTGSTEPGPLLEIWDSPCPENQSCAGVMCAFMGLPPIVGGVLPEGQDIGIGADTEGRVLQEVSAPWSGLWFQVERRKQELSSL